MFSKKFLVLLSCVFFFPAFLFAVEESLTITTYYPSPYGSYKSLQVDKLGVGDNNGDGMLSSADLPTTSGEAWFKGNVGIGTMSPMANLDLKGSLKIAPVGNQPDCNSNNRGMLWYTQAASGSSDNLEICRKDPVGNYFWVVVLPRKSFWVNTYGSTDGAAYCSAAGAAFVPDVNGNDCQSNVSSLGKLYSSGCRIGAHDEEVFAVHCVI